MIYLPALMFSSTLVLAVDSRIEIQFVQHRGKPMCCSTSNKNGQVMESKAFTMSTLRRTMVNLLQCSHRKANCIALKLSWIELSLMNAL